MWFILFCSLGEPELMENDDCCENLELNIGGFFIFLNAADN